MSLIKDIIVMFESGQGVINEEDKLHGSLIPISDNKNNRLKLVDGKLEVISNDASSLIPKSSLPISKRTGNMLKMNTDGMVVSMDAPPDKRYLHIDSLIGDDSSGNGTINNPFKSIAGTVKKADFNLNTTLRLKCGHDRPEYYLVPFTVGSNATVTIEAYGDTMLDGDRYNEIVKKVYNYKPWNLNVYPRPKLIPQFPLYHPMYKSIVTDKVNLNQNSALSFKGIEIIANPYKFRHAINYYNGYYNNENPLEFPQWETKHVQKVKDIFNVYTINLEDIVSSPWYSMIACTNKLGSSVMYEGVIISYNSANISDSKTLDSFIPQYATEGAFPSTHNVIIEACCFSNINALRSFPNTYFNSVKSILINNQDSNIKWDYPDSDFDKYKMVTDLSIIKEANKANKGLINIPKASGGWALMPTNVDI